MGTLRLMADGRALTVIAGDEPFTIRADPDVMERVIGNLAGNALKVTPESGRVVIAISRHGEGARVEVTDQGPGIPPEYRGRIFDKFFQVEDRTARLGTGLGLSFCKLAVEAHGGHIGVESEVGRGSTFWFTLPPGLSGCPAESGGLTRASAGCRGGGRQR